MAGAEEGDSIKVRRFDATKLKSIVANKEWSVVQIKCTQTVDLTVQFGLEYIKIFAPDAVEELSPNRLHAESLPLKDEPDEQSNNTGI